MVDIGTINLLVLYEKATRGMLKPCYECAKKMDK